MNAILTGDIGMAETLVADLATPLEPSPSDAALAQAFREQAERHTEDFYINHFCRMVRQRAQEIAA